MQIDLNDLPIPMRCPKCGAGVAPTMAQLKAEGLACPCGWRFTLEDVGIESAEVADEAEAAIRKARGIYAASAFAGHGCSASISSGQMSPQSSGRRSRRLTTPSVARSIAVQYWSGTGRTPLIHCQTRAGDALIARARAAWLPRRSQARSRWEVDVSTNCNIAPLSQMAKPCYTGLSLALRVMDDEEARDVKDEAERLRKLFEGLEAGFNRKKWAKESNFPGGPAMVQQHLNGDRPIALKALVAYARLFKCRLDDISPHTVRELHAMGLLCGDDLPQPDSAEPIGLPAMDATTRRVVELMRRTDADGRARCLEAVGAALAIYGAERGFSRASGE